MLVEDVSDRSRLQASDNRKQTGATEIELGQPKQRIMSWPQWRHNLGDRGVGWRSSSTHNWWWLDTWEKQAKWEGMSEEVEEKSRCVANARRLERNKVRKWKSKFECEVCKAELTCCGEECDHQQHADVQQGPRAQGL